MPLKLKASTFGAQSGPKPWLLFGAAVFILWGFGYETVWRRLTTEIEGVVVSAEYHPATSLDRAFTDYILRGANGQDQRYVAGATDASLPRHLAVGTRLQKRKWELAYMRDGKRIDDFPLYFYAGMLGIAFGCLTWAILLWRSGRSSARADMQGAA